jgi:hypothetical protein
MVSVTVFQIFKNKRLFIHAGLRSLFKSTYRSAAFFFPPAPPPSDDWYFYRNQGDGRQYVNTLLNRRELER